MQNNNKIEIKYGVKTERIDNEFKAFVTIGDEAESELLGLCEQITKEVMLKFVECLTEDEEDVIISMIMNKRARR